MDVSEGRRLFDEYKPENWWVWEGWLKSNAEALLVAAEERDKLRLIVAELGHSCNWDSVLRICSQRNFAEDRCDSLLLELERFKRKCPCCGCVYKPEPDVLCELCSIPGCVHEDGSPCPQNGVIDGEGGDL